MDGVNILIKLFLRDITLNSAVSVPECIFYVWTSEQSHHLFKIVSYLFSFTIHVWYIIFITNDYEFIIYFTFIILES